MWQPSMMDAGGKNPAYTEEDKCPWIRKIREMTSSDFLDCPLPTLTWVDLPSELKTAVFRIGDVIFFPCPSKDWTYCISSVL